MVESRQVNATFYKYILAAVVAIFTVYVSYTQGSNRIDERIEARANQVVASYVAISSAHNVEVDRRLAEMNEKLDWLMKQRNRGR